MNYADTGFIVSLYLPETTSADARGEIACMAGLIALTPLLRLETRNAFNRAVNGKRITPEERDAFFHEIDLNIEGGLLFVETDVPPADLHSKAMI